MMYKTKKVKAPADLCVGAEIGISGEGWETFTVTGIDLNADGSVESVHNSSGWNEPLCKIYLLRGRSHPVAMTDPTSWIQVAIGECDVCGTTFPDSCVYHYEPEDKTGMICPECWRKTHPVTPPPPKSPQPTELEKIASEALSSFMSTQNPSDYPPDHWSRRLIALQKG